MTLASGLATKSFLRPSHATLAVAAFFAWAFYTLHGNLGVWGMDLSALYLGARFVAMGMPELLYGAPEFVLSTDMPATWMTAAHFLGGPDAQPLAYVYPPIWAYLLAPLALNTDPSVFMATARVIFVGCYGLSILAVWRIFQPKISPLLFIALVLLVSQNTVPFQFAIRLAQPQFIVLALTLWAFERAMRDKEVMAGLLLGLAAAIKITPILFCILLIAEGKWRTAVVACTTAACIATLSLIIAGIGPHLILLERVSTIASLVPHLGMNLTFEAVTHYFFSPLANDLHPFERSFAFGDPVIDLLSQIALIGATIFTLWATRALHTSHRMGLRLYLLMIVFTFFSPLGWAHYYMPVLIILPALIGIFPLRSVALLYLVTALSLSIVAVYGVSQINSTGPITQFLGSAGVILAAVVPLIWILRQQSAANLPSKSATQ